MIQLYYSKLSKISKVVSLLRRLDMHFIFMHASFIMQIHAQKINLNLKKNTIGFKDETTFLFLDIENMLLLAFRHIHIVSVNQSMLLTVKYMNGRFHDSISYLCWSSFCIRGTVPLNEIIRMTLKYTCFTN